MVCLMVNMTSVKHASSFCWCGFFYIKTFSIEIKLSPASFWWKSTNMYFTEVMQKITTYWKKSIVILFFFLFSFNGRIAYWCMACSSRQLHQPKFMQKKVLLRFCKSEIPLRYCKFSNGLNFRRMHPIRNSHSIFTTIPQLFRFDVWKHCSTQTLIPSHIHT